MGAMALGATNPTRAAEKPNVILIFCDDMGYNDLSCFGSEKIKTPHLDRLAKEGRRFTNFMVPSSVCTPSRSALMTGCYPKRVDLHQHVLFPSSKKGLNPNEYTMAEMFKAAGYTTACIGKWHLGHYPETLPRAHGFDSYLGIPYSNDMNHPDNKGKQRIPRRDESWTNMDTAVFTWNTPLVRDEEIIELPVDQRMITRRYTDRAIEIVKENKDQPFFIYLPHSMPHVPLFVPPDAYDPNPANAYTCTIQHIDAEIGRLIQTVRDQGLAEKTLIIFTSDNGPWLTFKNHGGSALPLRDGKGTPFEGGQRVPCIVWGPGRIPAGTESGDLLSTMDLLPTLAALIGQTLPTDRKIDGTPNVEVITGTGPSHRKEFVYYTAQGALTGFREEPWKLLVHPRGKNDNQVLLFNLDEDISEQHNLAEKHPEIVARLTEKMNAQDAEITAHQRPAWKTDQPHPWPDNIK